MNTHGRISLGRPGAGAGPGPGRGWAGRRSKRRAQDLRRSVVFKLPVQIDDKERAELTGLKLFVRAVPGAWECRESAPAAQKEFSFRAPQDGEYWFSFATLDKAGAVAPASPDRESPGLIVIVDTRAPEITVRALPVSPGPGYLQCKLNDANPDYSTVRMEYATNLKGEPGWQALEPVTETPGVFAVPNPSVFSGWVRVRAADRAGNVAERIIDRRTARSPSFRPPRRRSSRICGQAGRFAPGRDSHGRVPAVATSAVAPLRYRTTEHEAKSPASIGRPIRSATAAARSGGPGNVTTVNSLRCNMAINVESPSDG